MTLWFVVLVVAAGARAPFGRRRSGVAVDETLIDLDEEFTRDDAVGFDVGLRGVAGEPIDPSGPIATDLDEGSR